MIHRTAVGDAEVVILNIATVSRTLDSLTELFPAVPGDRLAAALGGADAAMWAFNLVAIRLGEHVMLVDTGFGFAGGGPGASTRDLLREADLPVESITTIFITHGHGDHLGGLLDGDAPAFPRSALAISRTEYEFWTGRAGEEHYGKEAVEPARKAFGGYDDRTRTVDDGTDIVREGNDSISAVMIPGHTPGHCGLRIQSDGEQLLLLVDTLHTLFQLHSPDWSPRFDVDPGLAARSRTKVIAENADRKSRVHLFHFPFPGLGRFVQTADGYSWEPESS